MKTAIQILKDAKERLETYGWTQGAFINSAGECCALGALNRSCEFGDDYDQAHGALSRAAAAKTEGEIHSVAGYNDRVCKSKDDILSLFDTAIASLETAQ